MTANNRTKMGSFWFIVMIIAIAYGAFALLLLFTQHSLVYYPQIPTREIVATPDRIGLAYDEVEIITTVGRHLRGTLIEINPAYTHQFGAPIPELLTIGGEVRAILRERGCIK